MPDERLPFDHDAYRRRMRGGCFLCGVAEGRPGPYREHVVHRDEHLLAVLSQPPVQRGYVLVAPLRHVEHVVADLSLEEHVRIQTFLHHLGRALPEVLPVERLYLLSLGSQQGNAHVHWHVVPLPPRVPLEQQQLESVTLANGYLDLSQEEQADLAARIGAQVRASIARSAAS